MELILTKEIKMPHGVDGDYFKENSAISAAIDAEVSASDWVYVGMDDERESNNVLMLEKRVDVGDVVRGMLEWLKDEMYMFPIADGRTNETVGHFYVCPCCHSEWGWVNGKIVKENHADDCRVKPFLEVFDVD